VAAAQPCLSGEVQSDATMHMLECLVAGFYFVSKLLVKDLARVKAEYAAGDYQVAALFGTALAADILDMAAQFTVISGLAHNHLGAGLASAAALLVAADKASLVTAALSFSCGLSGELLALKHTDDDDDDDDATKASQS